jgi:L-ascorbate metabolism protein UlaG (beta-lactamase superfamily)
MGLLGISVMRTANAGVLLELDGKHILLDGVCKDFPPYLGTPTMLFDRLTKDFPDVYAITHEHLDHYDSTYAKLYKEKTLRSVIGPERLTFVEVGNGVLLSLEKTRHIGKSDVSHVSYVINGSKTIWFMGDATPLSLKNMAKYPKPDLIIVPFAFAVTPSAWKATKETGAKKVLLLHMPKKEDDTHGLWDMVESTVQGDDLLFTLDVGEEVNL